MATGGSWPVVDSYLQGVAMHRSRVSLWGRSVLTGVILLFPSAAILRAEPAAKRAEPSAEHGQWQEGLAALGAGEFDRASKLIHEVAATDKDNQRVKKVADWVTDFEKLQGEREKRVTQDYDKYVSWVKE